MRSYSAPSVGTGESGHAGGGAARPSADPSQLTQAERAARALEEDRREREVPIDRAFLASALDFRQTLRTLVAAAVPRLADWCFVDLVDGDGIPRRVEVAHADPSKASVAQEMRAIRFGPGWATPAAQAIRDRAPRLYRDLTNEVMAWATHDERHLAVLRAIRPNSLVAVPLVARDRAIGALTLIRSTTLPPLDERDLLFAADLAAPAALALDNARWYSAEKAARLGAEEKIDVEICARLDAEKAGLRLRRLESLAAGLGSVLAPGAIARTVAETALSLLEPSSVIVVADAGAGALECLHAQGLGDDLLAELRRFSTESPALVAEAFRIQTAIWVAGEDALAQRHPAAVPLARRSGDRAFAAVPLRADGRTVGALALGFPRPRELDEDERRWLLAVAQLAAQALERARLRGTV